MKRKENHFENEWKSKSWKEEKVNVKKKERKNIDIHLAEKSVLNKKKLYKTQVRYNFF